MEVLIMVKICFNCEKEYEPRKESQKYCSKPCLWANNGGKNRKPETWWTDPRGYIVGRVWIKNRHVFKRKHRWIMEKHLKRPLERHEVVHHINEDKKDNRIENLEIVPFGYHSTHHNLIRNYKRGYKLKLTDDERRARSDRAKKQGLYKMGQAKLAEMRTKATE